MREPLSVYRPDKTDLGDGSYSEAAPVDPNATVTVFGVITIHKGETSLIVDRFEDIKPEDIITTQDSATYRVLAKTLVPNSPDAMYSLERELRPIAPV